MVTAGSRSALGKSVVLGPGGEDLPFELCGEEGRLALETPAEPATPAAVSRLRGDLAPLGFRRHEPPEDESRAPRVVESGLAGSDDAVAVVEVILLDVFGAHSNYVRRRAGRGKRLVQVAAEDVVGDGAAGSTGRARNLIDDH